MSITSSIAVGYALRIHSLKLNSPPNMASVGLFPVNVSNSRIPKLYTSHILDTVAFDAHSVENIITNESILNHNSSRSWSSTHHLTIEFVTEQYIKQRSLDEKIFLNRLVLALTEN